MDKVLNEAMAYDLLLRGEISFREGGGVKVGEVIGGWDGVTNSF